MIRRFARPYARAMMEIVPSSADSRKLLAETEQFERIRRSSDELAEVFANPAIDVDEKIAVMTKISEKLTLTPLTIKFLDVLIRNHRLNDLGPINDAWRQMINAADGVSVAAVRAAHPLSTEEEGRLRTALETKTGSKIELSVTTDPTLLAGFVAQVGSEVWDASVSGQIDKLKSSLTR